METWGHIVAFGFVFTVGTSSASNFPRRSNIFRMQHSFYKHGKQREAIFVTFSPQAPLSFYTLLFLFTDCLMGYLRISQVN